MIGGFGTGIIYVGIIGLMVRWFPDRRGLATGLAAAGYGFGAFFTSFPDRQHDQKRPAMRIRLWSGASFRASSASRGAMAAHAARGLSAGRLCDPPPATEHAVQPQLHAAEMLKSPIFYLLFVMMSMMSTSGLMVMSNVGPFANEYKVADVLVLGMAALPLSLTLSRVTNGLTRPFFGWVSDHIGRESTMALAFSLEASPSWCCSPSSTNRRCSSC